MSLIRQMYKCILTDCKNNCYSAYRFNIELNYEYLIEVDSDYSTLVSFDDDDTGIILDTWTEASSAGICTIVTQSTGTGIYADMNNIEAQKQPVVPSVTCDTDLYSTELAVYDSPESYLITSDTIGWVMPSVAMQDKPDAVGYGTTSCPYFNIKIPFDDTMISGNGWRFYFDTTKGEIIKAELFRDGGSQLLSIYNGGSRVRWDTTPGNSGYIICTFNRTNFNTNGYIFSVYLTGS